VAGSKTWFIFPPAEAKHAYLYPSVHPHYHSSQIDLLEPKAIAFFPAVRNLGGLKVHVSKGDTLYVPRKCDQVYFDIPP